VTRSKPAPGGCPRIDCVSVYISHRFSGEGEREVAKLPKDVTVEIEAIALVEE